jgi:hypothetical protein
LKFPNTLFYPFLILKIPKQYQTLQTPLFNP